MILPPSCRPEGNMFSDFSHCVEEPIRRPQWVLQNQNRWVWFTSKVVLIWHLIPGIFFSSFLKSIQKRCSVSSDDMGIYYRTECYEITTANSNFHNPPCPNFHCRVSFFLGQQQRCDVCLPTRAFWNETFVWIVSEWLTCFVTWCAAPTESFHTQCFH